MIYLLLQIGNSFIGMMYRRKAIQNKIHSKT